MYIIDATLHLRQLQNMTSELNRKIMETHGITVSRKVSVSSNFTALD